MSKNHDTLYHHGVKGMRWGHRKKPEQAQPRLAKRQVYTTAQFTRGQVKRMQEERKRLEGERARLELLKKEPGHIEEKDSIIDVDTQKKIRQGISTVNTIVSIGGQAATLYNNTKKVAEISKPFVRDAVKVTNKVLDILGDVSTKSLDKGISGMRVD